MYVIENLKVSRLTNTMQRISIEQSTTNAIVKLKTNGPTFEFNNNQIDQLKLLVDVDQNVWNCAVFLKSNFLLEDKKKKEMLISLFDSWLQK